MEERMSELRGAYTALVTPFASGGGKIDLDVFEQLIRHQATGGVRGIVPCGTTGESPTLSEQEHSALVGLSMGQHDARTMRHVLLHQKRFAQMTLHAGVL